MPSLVDRPSDAARPVEEYGLQTVCSLKTRFTIDATGTVWFRGLTRAGLVGYVYDGTNRQVGCPISFPTDAEISPCATTYELPIRGLQASPAGRYLERGRASHSAPVSQCRFDPG